MRHAAHAGHSQLIDRSQPSLDALQRHEESDAYQDNEEDRRIGAGEVVSFGKVVDELAETAGIDEELDADDVDQREDQSEPHADEDRRQRGGKQDLPELLGAGQVEAPAHI